MDSSKSQVYEQIDQIQAYANKMEMKLNFFKTKFMLFNPTLNYDFVPSFEVEGRDIETKEEMKPCTEKWLELEIQHITDDP